MDRVEAVSGPVGQQVATSWEIFDAWLRTATALVGESAEALNAINVYPVPDSDTGTNLRLTLDGIASAVPGITPGRSRHHGAGRDPVRSRQLGSHRGRDADQRRSPVAGPGRRDPGRWSVWPALLRIGGSRGPAGSGPTGRGNHHQCGGRGRRRGGSSPADHPGRRPGRGCGGPARRPGGSGPYPGPAGGSGRRRGGGCRRPGVRAAARRPGRDPGRGAGPAAVRRRHRPRSHWLPGTGGHRSSTR